MAFPTTIVLDTATRANENPLSDGGKWSAVAGVSAQLQISSNAIVGTSAAQALNANKWTNFSLSGNAMEVFTTIATKLLVTTDYIDLVVVNSSLNGYGVQYSQQTGGTDNLVIIKLTGGTASALSTTAQEITNGDGIGLSSTSGVFTLWYRSGSGGAWTSLATFTDNTYSVSGMNIGIATGYTATSAGITNFGGGNYTGSRLPLIGVG